MNPQLVPLLSLSAAFLGLFALAELLFLKRVWPAEYTRKLVHAGTAGLTFLFPVWLTTWWQIAILCGAFLVLLVGSKRFGWLPSIHNIKRKSNGSWLYPVAVFCVFVFALKMRNRPDALLSWQAYFYIPVFILGACDPVAALGGRWWSRRRPGTKPGKTFFGSMLFFFLALVISLLLLWLGKEKLAPLQLASIALDLALATAVAERLSGMGWDNFTIPLTAVAVLGGAEWMF